MSGDLFFTRPMEPSDVDTLSAWLLDLDDLTLFDRTLTVAPSREALRELWKADLAGGKAPGAFWFTVEPSAGGPVAFAGLLSVNYTHGDATLAMLVAKSARGSGLGLRLGSLLLDIAFDRLHLRRVTTFFRADNERTARLVVRLGFREEGRMREAWLADGRAFDTVVVGLLRDEWYARRPAFQAELGTDQEVRFGRPEERRI
jgi:RimJ/RimL family protein N-acetyltransferase